jgi:hypothetical protein
LSPLVLVDYNYESLSELLNEQKARFTGFLSFIGLILLKYAFDGFILSCNHSLSTTKAYTIICKTISSITNNYYLTFGVLRKCKFWHILLGLEFK